MKSLEKDIEIKLNSIEEAIADIKAGKVIIVVDDENRENEGDFLAAADAVTPEIVNFMATHGKGLICVPITEKRCKELKLTPMVNNNSDPMETAFTVSVDLNGHGVTTGISASDRAKTIRALVDANTQPHHLSRPGHIFPLAAKEGGVLRRTGHTEAAIDFARLAGFSPAGVIVEIMNDDGSMARLPQLVEVAKRFGLKIVSIEDLVSYRMQFDSLIEKKEDFEISTRFGDFRLRAYLQTNNQQVHLALTKGNWHPDEPVLTRINATKINYDILGVLLHQKKTPWERVFKIMAKSDCGAIVYINQQHEAGDLLQGLEAMKNGAQNISINTDTKDFGIGAQILQDLNIRKLKLISNSNPVKRVGLSGYQIEIVDLIPY